MAPKIVVNTKQLPAAGAELIKWATAKGVELVDPSHATTPEEYDKVVADSGAVAIVNTSPLKEIGGWSDKLISGFPSSLKAVCQYGAGYDPLGDMNRFKAKNIEVSNTAHGVAQATADVGVYLILSTLRNFYRAEANLRQGNWLNGYELSDEYDGKTLGILGLGGIGQLVRDKIVGAFDFEKIQYHNRRRAAPEIEKDSVYVDSFDELIATSDVIFSVLPLTPSTHHLFNKESIAKAKKGSIIVNIGRGPVIEEEALVEALESGHIKSVGLDVFENEPAISPKLIANENTVLLPHIGTHTTVSRSKMIKELIVDLESVISDGHVKHLISELR